MATRVQIIGTERFEKVYDGRKSISFICQCVVFGVKTEVGVLRVPLRVVESLLNKDGEFPPGTYSLEYGAVIGFDDRNVKGGLVLVTPVADSQRNPIGKPDSPGAQPMKAVA
jgi:hypothetical protein